MATDIIARGIAAGVVSQVSADRQAVSEDRAAVETAKTEVLNVAESIPEDYSTLSADVSELKEDLADLTKSEKIVFINDKNISLSNYSIGEVVDLTPSDVKSYRYAILECNPSDVFLINCVGGLIPRAYAFLTSNNELIEVASAEVTIDNEIMIAPKNASKLIINDMKSNGTCYKGYLPYIIDNTINRLLVLENSVYGLEIESGKVLKFVQGSLPSGVLSPSNKFAISTKDFVPKVVDNVVMKNGYAVAVAMYDEDGAFIDYFHFDEGVMDKYYWTVSPFSLYDTVYHNCAKVKLVVQKNDISKPDVPVSESKNILFIMRTETSNTIKKTIHKNVYGKKLSVMGDSISTFNGKIPSGNAYQYPNGDVTTFNDTWVGQLLTETGMSLEKLESFAGSRVTTTGSLADGSHFVDDKRLNNLGNPDVIIVYGGTNDLFQTNPPEVGEIPNYFTTPLNTFDKSKFASAYLYLLMKLKEKYPDAKIYCCNITDYTRDIPTAYWENANGMSKQKMGEIISKCCDIVGATYIDLMKNGMTWYNYSKYSYDNNLHPNKLGMKLIADYIAKNL